MIYSPTCQYALRAMIHLSMNDESGPILGRTIAETESIPKQFLAKILHTLGNEGLVISTMGPGGGYELARPAIKITVHDVVEAIDGPLDLDDICILGLDSCTEANSCALHEYWKGFRKQYIKTISTLNLKDAGQTLNLKRRKKRS